MAWLKENIRHSASRRKKGRRYRQWDSTERDLAVIIFFWDRTQEEGVYGGRNTVESYEV